MTPQEASDTLKTWANHRGFSDAQRILEPDARGWWRTREVSAAIAVRVTVGHYDIVLRIGVRADFPLTLPEVAVASCSATEGPPAALTLPHVSGDGKLCFTPDDGVVLDRHDAAGILDDSFELAQATLTLATGPHRGREFLDELADHWRVLAKAPAVRCDVEPGDVPRRISAFLHKRALVAFADSQTGLAQSYPSRAASQFTAVRALYVPLECPSAASFEPVQLLAPDYLRGLCSAVPGIRKLLERDARTEEFVVLGVRTPNGRRVLLGLRISADANQHPLLGGAAVFEAVSCERVDKAILAPRGGADAGLSTARVVVIGCGAVGGHVAAAMARAGTGELCLIDPDNFKMENSFRHVCGMAHCGANKASGLAADLRRMLPHLEVTAEPKSIEEVVRRSPGFLQSFDLVVCATGAPTLEMHLNELHWKARGGPIIFAWLEPLGLGQHLVLTNPRSQAGRGCLECLWEHEPSGGLWNRAAFAAHGDYTRDLQGCGARHLPFANLDAEELALSVSRLALEAMAGSTRGPELRSRKGDPTAFRAEGRTPRSRFELSQQELHDGRADFGRATCPVCNRTP